jgi:nitroimidazol reductase NimA-like FMN-containing flavoprotein (pyridoxamine 5'-phosphate oxidase superfamily)
MKLRGPWSGDEIERFLVETRVPLRLACNGASGHPLLASLWFVPLGGKIFCATPSRAHIVRRLEKDPRCAFEVAPETMPYRGVRGRARVALRPERGREILELLAQRYLGDTRSAFARWLLERPEPETALEIAPESFVSWDFGARMSRR